MTCTVTAVHDHSVEVEIFGSVPGDIKRSDLARDRDEQRPTRFAPGDKVDAKLLQIDRNNRRVSLSIKALEVQEEKQAMDEYGSTDSGASLGEHPRRRARSQDPGRGRACGGREGRARRGLRRSP